MANFNPEIQQFSKKNKPLTWGRYPVEVSFDVGIQHAEIAEVERHLARGADVNEVKDKNKNVTPLIWVARKNQFALVKLLIEHGAKIDAVDSYGWTALMYAAESGYIHIVQYLLEHGADILLVSKKEGTALTIAHKNGNEDVIRLIKGQTAVCFNEIDMSHQLDTKFNYDEKFKEAVERNDAETLNSLLTPFFFKIYQQNGEPDYSSKIIDFIKDLVQDDLTHNVEALISHLTPNSFPVDIEKIYKAFGRAAVLDYLGIVKILARHIDDLDFGQVHDPGKQKVDTPLLRATVQGSVKVIQFLLENGARVNQANKIDETALIIGSRYGHESVVKLLMQHGADVNLADRDGETALMIAIYHKWDYIVKFLLENGAKVNIANKKGITPLMAASKVGHKEFLELLLAYGAEVNAVTNDNETALFVAANSNYLVTRVLLAAKADVNISNKKGVSPLMNAAVAGSYETVKCLLDYGANIEQKDNTDNTARSYTLSKYEKLPKIDTVTEPYTKIIEILSRPINVDLGKKLT